MIDYQIQANTRRCSATGRELKPGEKVFTVLRDEGGKFLRQDYCSEAWHGPPPGVFSFWVGRVPSQEASRRPRIDDELLMELFQRLEGNAEASRIALRYVLALLLIRRKKLRLEESRAQDGPEALRLRCAKTGTVYHVVDPRMSEEEILVVQQEALQLLGWE